MKNESGKRMKNKMGRNNWKIKLLEVSRQGSLPQENEPKDASGKYDEKDLAFYTQALSAWYQTNLECDKSKLTISSATIAFLIAVFCAFCTDNATLPSFLCLMAALVCHLVAIIISIVIFQKNARLIEETVNNKAVHSIGSFDVISWVFLGLGLFFSIVFVAIVGWTKLPSICG